MEFPNLGKNCSEPLCGRLDFLPVKCDGCNKVFCGEHYSYEGHQCPSPCQRDVQVPVCPLCNSIIPGKAGELPDIRVSRHIDSDCKSDTAMTRRTKVFNNRCSLKGCKQKELVPVLCDKCNANFCLKHRHPLDHSCENSSGKPVGKAGIAALARNNQSPSSHSSDVSRSSATSSVSRFFPIFNGSRPSNIPSRSAAGLSSLQGNISEDDALRMALEASLSSGNSSATLQNAAALSQEQEDFMLAKALAESEQAAAAAGGESSSSNRRQQQNCEIC